MCTSFFCMHFMLRLIITITLLVMSVYDVEESYMRTYNYNLLFMFIVYVLQYIDQIHHVNHTFMLLPKVDDMHNTQYM